MIKLRSMEWEWLFSPAEYRGGKIDKEVQAKRFRLCFNVPAKNDPVFPGKPVFGSRLGLGFSFA